MFVDEVSITVAAGKGGDGCMSFRRERGVPRGGPDGGNGGKGGSVMIRADRNVSSLLELRRIQVYRARVGQPGAPRNRKGAYGEDCLIRVPIGTVVRGQDTGEVWADLTEDGAEALVAQGGNGGRGNKTYASPTHQTPREFTYGEEGGEAELDLELKLIADVGLAGLPNAGKSTLLAQLSAATPRIADYPFTTLRPQLGIVRGSGFRSFVMADIPGLIEGAHDGAGLGHEFLRHIERTRVVAHMVDLCPMDGSDPAENVRIIRRELGAFSESLASRPQLLIGNKADLTDGPTSAELLAEELGEPVLTISAATGQGVDELVARLFELLEEARTTDAEGEA